MTLQTRIAPPQPGDELAAASIGPAGEALTLWGPPELERQLHARRGGVDAPSFAVTQTAVPWAARLAVTRPGGATDLTEVSGLTVAFPSIQPLPGGEFLIVGHRCAYTADGPEHNAAIIAPDGTPRLSGVLGDGIESVQTTPSGRIIVSYFDEGVFGNFGWGGAGGPDPIGASGLVEFDTELRRVATFPSDDEPVPTITDCYALNVAGEDVWACYYTDFPIVLLQDRGLRCWDNDLVTGAHHLLVHGTTAAFVGGYQHDRDTLTVAKLQNGTAEPAGRYRFEIDWASPAQDIIDSSARGSRLHQITADGHWYGLDLADLVR